MADTQCLYLTIYISYLTIRSHNSSYTYCILETHITHHSQTCTIQMPRLTILPPNHNIHLFTTNSNNLPFTNVLHNLPFFHTFTHLLTLHTQDILPFPFLPTIHLLAITKHSLLTFTHHYRPLPQQKTYHTSHALVF